MVKNRNQKDVDVPVLEKKLSWSRNNNQININIFGYKNGHTYPIYLSNKNVRDNVTPPSL